MVDRLGASLEPVGGVEFLLVSDIRGASRFISAEIPCIDSSLLNKVIQMRAHGRL